MGEGFLIDTNTLIDAQMKIIPAKGLQFLTNIINIDFTVSFISYIEFLGFKEVTKQSEEFISFANVIEINKTIIDACISLRKAHKIKLPDAIIAATAIVNNRTLITRNIIDFKSMKDIKILNLYDIV